MWTYTPIDKKQDNFFQSSLAKSRKISYSFHKRLQQLPSWVEQATGRRARRSSWAIDPLQMKSDCRPKVLEVLIVKNILIWSHFTNLEITNSEVASKESANIFCFSRLIHVDSTCSLVSPPSFSGMFGRPRLKHFKKTSPTWEVPGRLDSLAL